MYSRKFTGCKFKDWEIMIDWCLENFIDLDTDDPSWNASYPTFYFKNEDQYVLFLLMWGPNDR